MKEVHSECNEELQSGKYVLVSIDHLGSTVRSEVAPPGSKV